MTGRRPFRIKSLIAVLVLLALGLSGPLCVDAMALPVAHATMEGCAEPMPMPAKSSAKDPICRSACVLIDIALPTIAAPSISPVPVQPAACRPLIGLRVAPDHEPPRGA